MAAAPPAVRFRAVALYVMAPDALPATTPTYTLAELAALEASAENAEHGASDTGLLGIWYATPEQLARCFTPSSFVHRHVEILQTRAALLNDDATGAEAALTTNSAAWGGGFPGLYDPATGTAHVVLRLPADVPYATLDSARALLMVLDGRAREVAAELYPHERLDAIRLCHYYEVARTV